MTEHALNNRVIAVTRPVAQAKRLTAYIQQAGGNPLSFPLIEIVPLEDYTAFDASIAELNSADWAIFISTNAVESAMPRVVQKLNGFSQTPTLPPQLKFAAIGPVTAQALLDYGKPLGLQHVTVPTLRFDSEALLALPEMQAFNNQRMIIFRGVGGREVLAETLKKRGAIVSFAESYQRINPQQDCVLLANAVNRQQCAAIVVTSSEAMRHLLQLAENSDWLNKVPICVNHARIQAEASHLALQIHVADAPGDEAMLACITQALNGQA